MAKRKYFYCTEGRDEYGESEAEFSYSPGFALCQKQKCIEAFHQAIRYANGKARILEISSKSKQCLGVKLSAFNLTLSVNGVPYPVETVFQSSKVFEEGGPYIDLLQKSPVEAKKDERLRESGKLISFSFQGDIYPTEPKTAFYDWIYCSALCQHRDLVESVLGFDTFTDVEFNHKKSINCQARSAAVFVSIARRGLLRKAMLNIDSFIQVAYDHSEGKIGGKQISYFGENN